MTPQQRVLDFIKDFIDKLLVQKDYRQTLPMLDPDMILVGMGKKGIYRGLREIESKMRQKQELIQNDKLESAAYQTKMISDTVCLVNGEFLFLRENFGQHYELKNEMTAVCKIEEEQIRICQLHWSEPKTLEKCDEEQKNRNREFMVVTNTIPGGMIKCRNDHGYSMSQINNGFYDMLGYSNEELKEKFQYHYMDLIYPPDRPMVEKKVKQQLQGGKNFELEYRLLCKDGTLKWVLEKCQFVREQDGEYIYSVLLDNTANKKTMERLKISLERHNIIMSQTNDIIFDWNIVEDEMKFSPNWLKKFGYEPPRGGIKGNSELYSYVHPEDQKIFSDSKQAMLDKITYFEEQCRISRQDGVYLWCRVRITILYNNDGMPIRMIGVIIDIDREKKLSEELNHRAQRDLLTGIYNKETTRILVEEKLEKNPQAVSALFVIDLDNFKQINDELGHFHGDKVLAEVAAKLSSLFRTSDIIGRIGGDEFALFLSDIPNREFIRKKGDEILQKMREVKTDKEHSIVLSCSLGASISPEHGSYFEELYQKADKALYNAKKNGKKCICIYEEAEKQS